MSPPRLRRWIGDAAALESYLAPCDLGPGERLGFDLTGFQSRVTRELLLVRMRKQAQAFGVGEALIPAALSPDGTRLDVAADALLDANAAARERLAAGAEGPVRYIRHMAAAGVAADDAARRFAVALAGGRPGATLFFAYLDAATTDQEIGALKFCLPPTLRERLADLLPDRPALAALLRAEAPSLWAGLRARELALAALRRRGPAARYRRLLAAHRRGHGYLGAEDVDFRAGEQPEAIDARIAALDDGALAAERARLAAARDAARVERAGAATAFAAALGGAGTAEGASALAALVVLARRLAAHEDQNRRRKMRLLRDLRDLAEQNGLDIAQTGLADLAAVCAG